MARYEFQHDYRSGFAVGMKGDTVDLRPEQAHAIDRDSPGTLKMLREDPDAAAKAEEAIAKASDLETENAELKKQVKELKSELKKAQKDAGGPRTLNTPPHDRQIKSADTRAVVPADEGHAAKPIEPPVDDQAAVADADAAPIVTAGDGTE